MLLLDTNVVSDSLRPQYNPRVAAWFDATDRDIVYVSSITKAGLLFGMELMSAGKRRHDLARVISNFLAEELSTEILGFGSDEAEHYAQIVSDRRVRGRPIAPFDAHIAAIARARGFALVTRNVGDFAECGVELASPWGSVIA